MLKIPRLSRAATEITKEERKRVRANTNGMAIRVAEGGRESDAVVGERERKRN